MNASANSEVTTRSRTPTTDVGIGVTVIYDFLAAPGKAPGLLEVLRQGRDFGRTVEGCEALHV